MSLDLTIFSNLRERDLRREGVFITEGRLVTERALGSSWPMEGVVCMPQWAERATTLAGGRCPVAVLPEAEMARLAGFNFHRGMLGAGRRLSLPTVASVAAQARLLVALPEVNTVENLGAVFRSASALGADGVLLGERCGDPLSRRALKASAGSVFSLPFAESADLAAELTSLKASGYRIVGAVPDSRATDLRRYRPPARLVVLFGNEADGLDRTHRDRCDDLVTIPMCGSLDSLNLAVAAGIVLYAVAAALGRLPDA